MKTLKAVEEFKNKKQELKDWLYGTVYKGYDQEEEAEVVQQDVEDHFTDEWFTNLITQDRQHTAQVLCELLEGIDEYMAVKDNDSHRYEIPRSKKDEWDAFCDIPSDNERSWDVPEWAERIDGMPVRSYKEQAQALIRQTLVPISNQE